MLRIHIAAMCIMTATVVAFPASAYKRESTKRTPKLPGIIHAGSCTELAPGVYDCGNKKNEHRVQNKKTGRWKIVYRPTADVAITAQSKAEHEAKKNNN